MDDDIKVIKNSQGIETFIFEPYNPINRLITNEELTKILSTYGITTPIYNYQLYKRAFIHRSYVKRPIIENQNNNIVISPKPDNCIPLFSKSNERLEFVGDGILECITKLYLYKRFPKEQEGFMTEKKIALVKNESIGRIAYEMGLHNWFILSKNAEEKQTRINLKKLGCLFEAFIGAIFLDFNRMEIKDNEGWFSNMFISGPGFQMVEVFITNVFKEHVNWIELIQNDDNYKNILQVKIQKEFKVTPEYLEMTPYSNENGYNMGVFLCLGQMFNMVSHSSENKVDHSVGSCNLRCSTEMRNVLKLEQLIPITQFKSFHEIHEYMAIHGKIFVLLGEGCYKIKKKAEQIACELAIYNLQNF
jgi:dsRNA-specific ribonuclease